METILDKSKIIQIGFLTRDVEKTTKMWAEFLGQEVPPIHDLLPYEQTQAEYDGNPCYGRNRQSFFEFGNVQIEIIEPVTEFPSYWKECLDKNGEGLHHLAFGVKDMSGCIQMLEDNGTGTLRQCGEFPGGRYAYVDAMEKLKLIIEFLEFDGKPL